MTQDDQEKMVLLVFGALFVPGFVLTVAHNGWAGLVAWGIRNGLLVRPYLLAVPGSGGRGLTGEALLLAVGFLGMVILVLTLLGRGLVAAALKGRAR